MINIHILIDRQTITLTLQEESTFLDLIMAVKAECQTRNLPLPAQYHTEKGGPHARFTLGHLGLSLQQIGIHHDTLLQTGVDSTLTGGHQDLTIQNLRTRMQDIILGSLAKEISEYRTAILLRPFHPPEPNTPQTCALLALAYQYQLISAEKAQDMISTLQSRYADQIIPVNSQEHVIYTMLNLMLGPAGQLPKAEPAEEKPEPTADKKNPPIAKIFSDLPLGLQNMTRDYIEDFEHWISDNDISISMFKTYYNQRMQPLYHLYRNELPENWDELTTHEKTIFLEEHLPEDKILHQLGLCLSRVKENLNQMLLSGTRNPTAIWLLQLALDLGADINHKDGSGMSVLMRAIDSGNLIAIKILLAQPGIDVNGSKNDGLSPLMLASSYGNLDMVKLLLAHPDIQIDRMDGFDNTALHYAAERGNEDLILEMLLAHDADENHTNKDGDSALILAANSNHAARVKILLKHGVNVNHANNDGETALIGACHRGYLASVPILLKYGADVNHISNDGDTALKILRREYRESDAEYQTILLLEKEVKASHRTTMSRLSSGFLELNRSLPNLLQTKLKDDKQHTQKKEVDIELNKLEGLEV